MKKILLVLALFGAFYGHARISFSEPRLMTWIASHSARAMSGDPSACDDYASDLEVSLTAEGSGGRWDVEGGREEMCGYMKQAAAAFTVLQASTHTEFDRIEISRDGFPWMSAKIKYVQRTTVSASRIPSMTIESDDTLELVRTLTGFKIRAVDSHSTGGI